jgi:hypothetical protein
VPPSPIIAVIVPTSIPATDMSLQGATSVVLNGKGFMCNGANLAYTKTFFQELNGFDGNDKIASGDDVFYCRKRLRNFLIKSTI